MRHLVMRFICTPLVLAIPVMSALFGSPPSTGLFLSNGTRSHDAKTQPYESGSSFAIEFKAFGDSQPRFYWRKDEKQLDLQAYGNRIQMPDSDAGTLVINLAQDEDSGQYQCIAENEWGVAIAREISIRKEVLDSLPRQDPITLTAVEGDPFKLPCEPPDGWPKPDVYWVIESTDGKMKFIDDYRMTVDPEGNLWFSNVTRNDASNDSRYACVAHSVFGNEREPGNRILLNVIPTEVPLSENKREPVRQYVSREKEVVLLGKEVELFCIYGGTPSPRIVWKKRDQLLASSDRIRLRNHGRSLVFKRVSFEDEERYTCEASNGVGNAESYSIDLEVLAIPYFDEEYDEINAQIDEKMELHCRANGLPEPQIKWIYNGKPIEEAALHFKREVNGDSVVIEKLEKQDIGSYGCNASNDLGYAYKEFPIRVLDSLPEFVKAPENRTTVNGVPVIMTCNVTGFPRPEVKWIRNGRRLFSDVYAFNGSAELTIRDVNFMDAGKYTCVASNRHGSINASGILVVKERTIITDKPEDCEVVTGTTATFRCDAVTDPSLNLDIFWRYDHGLWQDLVSVHSRSLIIQGPDHSLTVTETTAHDSGTYTCLASTIIDEAGAQATLKIQSMPDPPRLAELTCNNNKAVLRGLSRYYRIDTYVIQYNTGLIPDEWKEVNLRRSVEDGTFFYEVSMRPWANYTFRIITLWFNFVSAVFQHIGVCTTESDVPEENPENIRGEGTDSQNIVISWTQMRPEKHNGPRFAYRVLYRRDIPGEEWLIEDIDDWRQQRLEVNNQPTYQRYKIKVLAMNENGVSKSSPKEVTGYSGKAVPLQAPMNFAVLNVTGSASAILSWDPILIDSSTSYFDGYKIQIWTDKKGKEAALESHVKNDSRGGLFSIFLPYSNNHVRVRAYKNSDNGPPSATLSFETPEGVPGTVSSFEGLPIGSGALHLTWQKPEEPNGILTGYRVYYCTVDGEEVGPLLESEPPIRDPEATSATLAGLNPGTKYRIHIRATTKVGEGQDYFTERSTRRADSVPTIVPNFTWELISTGNATTTMRVTRLQSPDGNSSSHFFVKYKIKGERFTKQTKHRFDGNSIEVSNLSIRKIYEVSIVVVDGGYYSESMRQEVDTSDREAHRYGIFVSISKYLFGTILVVIGIGIAVFGYSRFPRRRLNKVGFKYCK